MLKLQDIRLDGGTQHRKQTNQDLVKEYAERMRNGVVFPPVIVMFDKENYWLVDGFHRYYAAQEMGQVNIAVELRHGTLRDARILSWKVNANHGLPRDNATKRACVEDALADEEFKTASNKVIASLCEVSDTFVASVRNPEIKKKQAEKLERHYKKKFGIEDEDRGSTAPEPTQEPDRGSTAPVGGEEPDADELKANELAMQADLDALNKLLEADDALATAHEEIKRLNHLVAQKEVRIAAIMREKSECIKLCKKLQTQLDKVNKK